VGIFYNIQSIANLLPFIACTFLAVLAILVVSTGRLDRYRGYFALFLFCGGVWAGGIGVFLSTKDVGTAEWLANLYYAAALFIAYSLLIFVRAIPDQHGHRHGTSYALDVALLAPLVVAEILLFLFSKLIVSVDVSHFNNTVVLNTALYPVYAFIFVAYAVAAFVIMVKKYRAALRSSSRIYRLRLSLVVWSIVFGMLFGSFFNLILPLFGNYSFLWLGPIGIIPSSLIFWYAVLRHGLFDIRSVAARGLMYFLLLGSLLVAYAALTIVLGRLLIHNDNPYISGITDTASAIILAFSFPALRHLFDRFTYRLFYKNDYDLVTVQRSINEVLATNVGLEMVAKRVLEIVQVTLGATYARLIVYDGHQSHRYGQGAERLTRQQKNAQIQFASYVRSRPQEMYSQTDLLETFDTDAELIGLAHRGSVAMALRLAVHQETIAVLMVGPKRHSGAYKDKDYEFLGVITEEFALALQNALRLIQIGDFTANLQTKVQTATRQLRASNRRLRSLDDAKDEFISLASHQLRTPLTSVKGYISMILDGDVGPISDEQRRLLASAYDASNRMVGIIGDFLNVSRLQSGKFMLERQPVNMAQLVADEVEHLKTTAYSHGVTLLYKRPADFPLMQLDKNKIEQVVMNLIDNAIFYAPNTEQITILLYEYHGRAVFKVVDHGMGVPRSEQKKLFGKFFRAMNARQARPDGTGVGIFLARKVILAHGGSMIFKSVEGRGSTFGFELPLS